MRAGLFFLRLSGRDDGSFFMDEKLFTEYKNDLKKYIERPERYENQEITLMALDSMKRDLGFDEKTVRDYAMKISKYVHQMSGYMAADTGEARFDDLYWRYLLLEAQNYQVDSGLLYLEKNRVPKERFYEPRRDVFLKHQIVSSLQDLMNDDLDILVVSLPPGTGKQLSDDTPILTTSGWKKHGDLIVGDKVFGMDGKPKKVIHVFPKSKNDCLITFTNGERIQCHENHEWLVYDRHKHRERIVETKELMNLSLETGVQGKRGHRYFYQIPTKKPLKGEFKDLSVSPYILGAWLGDGTEKKPTLTICNKDYCIIDEVKKEYELSAVYEQIGCKAYHFLGLRKDLQKLGMCHSRKKLGKRIPDIYFSADINQRLELLAGLIDTDGDCAKKEKKYHFSTTNEELKDGFIKLISTFGWRCCVTETKPLNEIGKIKGKKKQYKIGFSPTFEIPCRVERKKLKEFSKQRKISIKSIEKVLPKTGNCIQVEGGIYCAGNTMIPTHNSTIEVFFLSLVGGWFPNDFNLSSAHSSILTRSLYDGVLEIINDPVEYTWHEIFPLVKQNGTNAKETTINLERAGRFKTWTFRSIDGSLTGATRCNRILTADDLVSGIEEALNKSRLETLWTKVVNDLFSRMLDGCKRILFMTRWSVHDPAGKLYTLYEGNPRVRFIAVPALNENGESNFQFSVNGFSTKYYLDQKEAMDDISFNCLYQQQPVEREGLLFPPDELRRFFVSRDQVPERQNIFTIFPEREPDAIWGVCDTKDKGTDYESLPIAYQFGEDFYILDVVFDDTTDYDTLDKKTADILIKHQPHKTRFESNQAGGRIAANIEKIIKGKCRTIIDTKYTTANKETKILVNSDWIKKHCLFFDASLYTPKSDYGLFMGNVTLYTTRSKVPHDDGPDSLAMLAEYVSIPERRKTKIKKSPY